MLKVLDLTSDLVLSFHKYTALRSNIIDLCIHLLQVEIDLVFILNRFLDVLRHSFLLISKKK